MDYVISGGAAVVYFQNPRRLASRAVVSAQTLPPYRSMILRASVSDPTKSRPAGFLRLPRRAASKVCPWGGSQHRPKHFNEGAYTVVTDCDGDLRDGFPLCQHLKGGKQPRLLPPTTK